MTEIEFAYLVGAAVGLLVGAFIALMLAHWRYKTDMAAAVRMARMEKTALEEKLSARRRQLEKLGDDLAEAEQRLDKRRETMAELQAQKAALEQIAGRIPELEAVLEKSRLDLDQSQVVNLALEKERVQLSTRLEAERRQTDEKITLLMDARQELVNEFKVLAERIFEEKGRSFADHNKVQMDGLLGPLREQLGAFKKRVEDVYDKESRDRATLLNEIGHLKHLNERIGKDALNLTKALKGDVKTMGGWGEVILERILEASGLEKGRAYNTQVSLTDHLGKRYQPDVVVRLPEGRDVIVDAKVSLTAYARFHAAGDEAERVAALKSHLSSLRNHFNGLSEKHYEDLEGVRTLDFVLMFVPIEAAYATALAHDRSLFGQAFAKNVILVSPATLLVTLRTIAHIWRQAAQNENAREIARQAGGLYDKFIGFIEALETVGQQLDRAKTAYLTARDRLSVGRGNLVRRAQQLKALGVKANKTLPTSYATETIDERRASEGGETGRLNPNFPGPESP